MRFIVSAPRPFEDLLERELDALGIRCAPAGGSSVAFDGDLEHGYRVVLWSRVATRIVAELAHGAVATPDEIYECVASVDWGDYLAPAGTLSVSYQGTGAGVRNTRFGGQKVKDAIVDQFRARGLGRPSVDSKRPDLAVTARFRRGELSVGFDLGGGSLHRRGYRPRTIEAPLKENLAAALLMRVGWPEADEAVLLDPMCGSGTLLIEGAMIAYRMAPGLMRPALGFGRWLGHDRDLWNQLRAEAKAIRDETPRERRFLGADLDPRAIHAAREALMRAGLEDAISVSEADARHWAPEVSGHALLISNLPYGERLGEVGPELRRLYREAGNAWRRSFAGQRFALLVSKDEVSHHLPLKVSKRNTVWNGRLECWLLQGTLEEAKEDESRQKSREQIANRLRKNQKRLARWVKEQGIEAYRVYDADMPEYAVAIDRYGDWLHVQEYAPPKSVDATRAQERLDDLLAAAPEALGVDPAGVVLKVRERKRGHKQYGKQDSRRERLQIREGAVELLVNLRDYLDTGLFLDHRPTRLRIAGLCRGKRFLNLFAYTGAASVHAAAGGARSTTTVDLSNTYLDWAEDNLRANGLEVGRANRLLRADASKWIAQDDGEYDLIFCDPPVFSNSKAMDETFDVQRDHAELIEAAMARLAPDGLLIFSTNLRKFSLDPRVRERFAVEDVSAASIPRDFERNQRIHVCFDIRHRG